MWSVRPSVTCNVDTKPLQTLGDCVDYEMYLVDDWVWPDIWMGLHEGLDAQETSVEQNCVPSIAYTLAGDPANTCTYLDYCIRRGCNVSCCDNNGLTVLQRALVYASFVRQPSPRFFIFFQILVDAHALFDGGTTQVPKKIVAAKIREYVDGRKRLLFQINMTLLEQVAMMYDK